MVKAVLSIFAVSAYVLFAIGGIFALAWSTGPAPDRARSAVPNELRRAALGGGGIATPPTCPEADMLAAMRLQGDVLRLGDVGHPVMAGDTLVHEVGQWSSGVGSPLLWSAQPAGAVPATKCAGASVPWERAMDAHLVNETLLVARVGAGPDLLERRAGELWAVAAWRLHRNGTGWHHVATLATLEDGDEHLVDAFAVAGDIILLTNSARRGLRSWLGGAAVAVAGGDGGDDLRGARGVATRHGAALVATARNGTVLPRIFGNLCRFAPLPLLPIIRLPKVCYASPLQRACRAGRRIRSGSLTRARARPELAKRMSPRQKQVASGSRSVATCPPALRC